MSAFLPIGLDELSERVLGSNLAAKVWKGVPYAKLLQQCVLWDTC
jgi:hypothetical protein